MTPERYNQILKVDHKVTAQEFAEGWHFCRAWDHMLIGPGMPEMETCICLKHPPAICETCED